MEDRALSFGEEAKSYDEYRPRYPREAVEWVMEVTKTPIHDVVDVGAGTGALTALLVSMGFAVTAFDADEKMIDQLRHSVPEATAGTSRAEQLPLGNASVDAVTVAQAFHWFDPVVAAHEFTRVLRPGGVIGLFWNLRDDRASWWGALRPIIDGPDWVRGDADEAWRELEHVFPGLERREFAHSISMSPERIVKLVNTFSFVRLHEDVEQILDQVREILATHPETKGRDVIEVPYVTAAYRVSP